ncbi:transmembrane emp24 domain-containing protein 5-like [Portunus trituberculatus]|uniref:transmembrane emp24 domain-containing protein 5-like n=1 Tax=Portunus trituberculatus TaxID=210409 RepID=UPI001E1CC724|nr:transmembrane emp24 domain-containing protein 5-like [Portunus trituberculatus]
MASHWIIVGVSIFLSVLTVTASEDWAFDNAPGIAMEYKVHIDAGKEDCYYQYVHPSATIYVNMQVLKGGDGMAGMAVRNPRGEIVYPYSWKQSSEYEEVSQTGGYYAVCIDNQFSRFAAKLVNLYITTFRYDLWEKYTQEIEDLDISVTNFTHSIKGVDQHIHNILLFQSQARAKESRDFQLLISNNNYVLYWSLLQCIAIIATGALQVYFVRKLFSTDMDTKSGRRA